MAKLSILNIKVDKTTKERVLKKVEEWISKKRKKRELPKYIVTPNPEIALKAYKDPELAKIINKADIAISDGIGFKMVADTDLTVIKGRELVLDILTLANRSKKRIYFLGGKSIVNKAAVEKAKIEFPNISIKGSAGAIVNKKGEGIDKKNIDIDKKTLTVINRFGPDVLFVALGAPKQEYWIGKNIEKLNARVIMAVGGSLDYYTGVVKLPPAIMATFGLEWAWRLFNEPVRFERILNAVVVFPVQFILHKIKVNF